jgi:hypothetical protein
LNFSGLHSFHFFCRGPTRKHPNMVWNVWNLPCTLDSITIAIAIKAMGNYCGSFRMRFESSIPVFFLDTWATLDFLIWVFLLQSFSCYIYCHIDNERNHIPSEDCVHLLVTNNIL